MNTPTTTTSTIAATNGGIEIHRVGGNWFWMMRISSSSPLWWGATIVNSQLSLHKFCEFHGPSPSPTNTTAPLIMSEIICRSTI